MNNKPVTLINLSHIDKENAYTIYSKDITMFKNSLNTLCKSTLQSWRLSYTLQFSTSLFSVFCIAYLLAACSYNH